jgi:hypothetical protein
LYIISRENIRKIQMLYLWTQEEGQLNQGIQNLDVLGGGNIFWGGPPPPALARLLYSIP